MVSVGRAGARRPLAGAECLRVDAAGKGVAVCQLVCDWAAGAHSQQGGALLC